MRSLAPIVDRELRVAARRPGPFRLRFLTATGATLLGGLHLLLVGFTPVLLSAPGRGLFELLARLGMGCALLSGPLLTADCLSRERREGTLGFLFLTDLRGFDIVAGKLAALGLIPVHGLLAALPIASLCVVMGGVTGSELLRVTALILGTTFLSLAIGLWVSSRSTDERQAIAATLGVLTAGLGIPWAAGWLARAAPQADPLSWLSLGSPLGLFPAAFGDGQGPSSGRFAIGLLAQHLLAWLLLAAASRQVTAAWKIPAQPSTSSTPSRQPWLPFLHPLRARLEHRRRHRLARSGPLAMLAWRSSWARIAIPWVTAGSLLVTGILFTSAALSQPPMRAVEAAAPALAGGWLLLKLLLLVHIVYFLQDACRSGLLELLLTTPVTSRNLREGHFAAARELVLRPVLLLGLGSVLLNLTGRLLDGGDWPSRTVLVLSAMAPPMLSVAVHALDLLALAFHATTWSLRYDRPVKVLVRSGLLILFIPNIFCGQGRFLIDLLVLGQMSPGLDRFRDLVRARFFPDRRAQAFGIPRLQH